MIVIVSYWWMKWVASLVYRLRGSRKIYSAQSIFIFIILREAHLKEKPGLINHEKIHWRQQLELLFIGHWFLYLVFYFYNLVRLGNHEKAYRKNPFEREAYCFDWDDNYLAKRPLYNWRHFF